MVSGRTLKFEDYECYKIFMFERIRLAFYFLSFSLSISVSPSLFQSLSLSMFLFIFQSVSLVLPCIYIVSVSPPSLSLCFKLEQMHCKKKKDSKAFWCIRVAKKQINTVQQQNQTLVSDGPNCIRSLSRRQTKYISSEL